MCAALCQSGMVTERKLETAHLQFQATYSRRRYLLSIAELRLAHSLMAVMPRGLLLMWKVRLADVVKCRFENRIALRQISQKHLDFVIVGHSSSILGAIELDDRSHLRANRASRDRFVNSLLASLRIRLVRLPVRQSYDERELETLLRSFSSSQGLHFATGRSTRGRR